MNTVTLEQDFLALLRAHAGVLHKLSRWYADDADDRRDLHQDMVFEAWRAYPSFRGEAAFGTWLYRVALNTALTFRRKALRQVTTTELQAVEHWPEQSPPALSHQAELLYQAVRQLPAGERAIITLHLDGYDNADIADITGLSKNHVAVKLHRLKTALENQLKNA